MRTIRKLQPGPGLEVCDAPAPTMGAADVLIRVHHAGVCGTDLHIAQWDEWAQGRIRPPVTLGHEFAGEIVEVGEDVGDEFAPGQLVTAEGHIICGHCRQCRTGNGHICQRTSIIGVDRDGAFADHIAMPATNVMALGEIPTTIGAIMDPMGNAFHTVLTGTEVPGSVVLVIGCGPIGCFAVGIARAAGASLVIGTDINPTRLALARGMGAQVLLNPQHDDVVARILEATGGEGADIVCEMSGHPAAVAQAFKAVRLGGRVQLLGLPKGAVPLNLSNDVIFKGVTVYGVIGRRMYETWHQMRTFLSSGRLDPTPVITHRFPLEQIDEALEAIASGAAGKVILEIGD
ncbi:MAG: L-threonine 3-dehydrogenase [Gemmatimonadota bacterium]|nr:L-threonine 3-dehydrogenase [Gemmatimonadota bacterium]